MALFDSVKELQDSNRLYELERRADSFRIDGDFTGSVQGKWIRLDQSGAGIVRYKSKDYTVMTIGFVSLPSGTSVELSYAEGVYYAKF